MADPFDTAGIRRRVLSAWSESPGRFREDANAEEDYARGGYRDRLIIELAQNASDAATRAGVPGVLRLELVDGELRAANVGAPLSAEGVESLASLRASAKRDDDTVGRFGVGFAAVLAVSDAPRVVSQTGAVRFSAADTRHEVSAVQSLRSELDRRGGVVPVLRLAWPGEEIPPDGYVTEVRLPLLPGAEEMVRTALAEVSVDLLLALPGLARIELPDRVLLREDIDRDWRMVSRSGVVPRELLADRPVEERERGGWSVTCAVPIDGELDADQVVHAPTLTDEPLSLPVRVIATYPLSPDRRHVAPGPLADFISDRIAEVYASLLALLPSTPSLLRYVPPAGLARSPLDADIGDRVLRELQSASLLSTVDSELVRPAHAVVIEDATPQLIAAVDDLLEGLLSDEWSRRDLSTALTRLGVRRLSIVDLIELLATVDRPATWWRQVYDGLAEADRDRLESLPVPLADGRTVVSPRGALLPAEDLTVDDLPDVAAVLGLRIVHPDAVHPLLERLGARTASARSVLADDRVRAAVEGSYDADDPTPLVEAVLALVRAAGLLPGELPWLAELALPTDDGDWSPAAEMLAPASDLARVVVPDSPFAAPDPTLVTQWGDEVLAAVGVLSTFAVLREADVEFGADHDLDAELQWQRELRGRLPEGDVPPRVRSFVAVRDLELVRADAWPTAVKLLAALEDSVLEPAQVELYDGREVELPSYTRWWLQTHDVLDGRRPDRLRIAAAEELAGLYDVAPVDADVAALVGVRDSLEDVLADPTGAAELLQRLGDSRRMVVATVLADVYPRLAVALDEIDVPPPDRVRVLPDVVVPRDAVVVLDLPYLLPLLTAHVVPGGDEAVADLLDVSLASDVVRVGSVPSSGVERLWADVPGVELAAARCGGAVPAGSVVVRAALEVDGVAVTWWPREDVDHVVDDPAAYGRALAWRLDAWGQRAAAVEAFARPDDLRALAAEDAVS